MSIANEPESRERELRQRELRQAQAAVERRLDRVRRRLRWQLVIEGMFWVVAAVVAAAAGSLAIDRLLRFDPPTRIALGALLLAGIVYVTWRKLLAPLLLRLDNLDLAQLLDRRMPGVGQQIANVLELPRLLAEQPDASPSMIRAAVLECMQSLDRRDLLGTLNIDRGRKLLAAAGVLLGLVLGFCFFFPGTAGLWARRWLAASDVRWPQRTYLVVEGLTDGGSLLVPRGETSLVQINAQPKFHEDFPGRWLLAGRGDSLAVESSTSPASTPPEAVSLEYTAADGTRRRGNAEQFDSAHFRYELPPLAEPIELDIAGGDDWLEGVRVEPIDRPAVAVMEITALRPGASSPEVTKVGQDAAQLLFLPQTQLTLTLVADAPLASAEALEKGAPLSGWTKVDEKTYTLEWTMKDSLAIEFRLVGQRGSLLSKPYFLAVGLLKDREPRVTIRTSGVGRRITPVARVPLAVRANDDFALAGMTLDWELTSTIDDKPKVENKSLDLEPFDPRQIAEAPRTEHLVENELELRDSGLKPGNTLKLRGAAVDACALGAQAGRSRWLSFQIVAADELFYEILMRQREQRAKFAAALESARAQAKTLASLDKADDLPGLGRAQQVINRQVFQVTGQLAATLEEMTLNDLGNPQARETLQTTIITPLNVLHNDLLARLRTSIDGVSSGGKVDEARRGEAHALSEQAVEAMQSILSQMSLWESFVDVINQLKSVIDRQSDVLKSTEEVEKARTNELFD